MIFLNKIEIELIEKRLTALSAKLSEITIRSNVPNEGSGNVNNDLKDIVLITKNIQQSLGLLIDSTAHFAKDYKEKMTGADDFIAGVISSVSNDFVGGADK